MPSPTTPQGMRDQSSGVSTTPCAGRPAQSSFSPESRYERSSSSAAATTRLVPGSVQVSHAALIGNPADETLDYKKDITRPCCASRRQRIVLIQQRLVFGAGRFVLGHVGTIARRVIGTPICRDKGRMIHGCGGAARSELGAWRCLL